MPTFVITGSPRSGKDTFISFVETYYPNTINFSSIDFIRWVSKNYFNYDEKNKDLKSRKFLSDFKRILTDYNDFPFEQCKSVIEKKDDIELLFLHVRELSEIKKLTNFSDDVKVVYVENNDNTNYGNISDDDTKEVKGIADIIIHNDKGLEELNVTARDFVETFVIKENIDA